MSGVFLPLTHTISRFFAPAKGDFYKVGFYLNWFGRLSGFRAFLSDGGSRKKRKRTAQKRNPISNPVPFFCCMLSGSPAFGWPGWWTRFRGVWRSSLSASSWRAFHREHILSLSSPSLPFIIQKGKKGFNASAAIFRILKLTPDCHRSAEKILAAIRQLC